eukprot:s1523_g9.t1
MRKPRKKKKMKVITTTKVPTMHMVVDTILDLMMGVEEEVLQNEDDEVPVLIHRMEKIQMEVPVLIHRMEKIQMEVNREANDYVRSYDGKIIKGRQIIAMMYESFRTRDRLDVAGDSQPYATGRCPFRDGAT